jgi:hypothetical protein
VGVVRERQLDPRGADRPAAGVADDQLLDQLLDRRRAVVGGPAVQGGRPHLAQHVPALAVAVVALDGLDHGEPLGEGALVARVDLLDPHRPSVLGGASPLRQADRGRAL